MPPLKMIANGSVLNPAEVADVTKALTEGTGLAFGMTIRAEGDSIIVQSTDPRMALWQSCYFDLSEMEAEGVGSGTIAFTPNTIQEED